MLSNKNIINGILLEFTIVNCEDIKIEIWDVNGFYLNTIYYSLNINILKYNYSDIKENFFTFTEEERKKIKKICLKMFFKEYKKINDSDYKKKQIEKIKKYMED